MTTEASTIVVGNSGAGVGVGVGVLEPSNRCCKVRIPQKEYKISSITKNQAA